MLSLSYTVPLTILSLVALISNVILILVIVLCKQVSCVYILHILTKQRMRIRG